MKWLVMCAVVVAAYAFVSPAVTHAIAISGEQKGTENGGNKTENAFKWSHAFKYSGDHEAEPFKFNYSFGSSQGNKGGQQSQNGQGDASKWSHSQAFKGTLEAPLKFSFGSSQGNQGGQKSQNGEGDASKWSHSQAFKGTLEAPLKFSFGSSQDNQGGQKSQNGEGDAFEWSHSHAFKGTLDDPLQFSFDPLEDGQSLKWSHSFQLSGDQQEDPFKFKYEYGSLIDVEGSYMSMNGPEYAKWQGDVLETSQHFYYYESYGSGGIPDTGYIPPEGPYAAPEPVSILLMGLGSLWIVSRRKT